MKIDRKNPKHWILLSVQALYTLIAIGRRVLRRGPADSPHCVILYGHQLSGNLKALYDRAEQTPVCGMCFYFLSLDPAYSLQLKREGIRVLQCNKLHDMLMLARTAAIITDHGLHAMAPLLHLTDILFIDVWHGIPFKGFIPEDFRLQHRYHEAWTSSPTLKALYDHRFGFLRARCRAIDMGYARVDQLFQPKQDTAGVRASLRVTAEQKLVLYAPTWRQDKRGRELFPFAVSGSQFTEALARVCRQQGATLVIRSHLNAEIACEGLENVVYCSQSDFADTEALLLETAVLLCDWSSIAFDFLALARPTLFMDVEPPFANGFSLGPEYRYGAVVGSLQDLCAALTRALSEADTFRQQYGEKYRQVCAEVYGENTDGGCARRQLKRLSDLLQHAQ